MKTTDPRPTRRQFRRWLQRLVRPCQSQQIVYRWHRVLPYDLQRRWIIWCLKFRYRRNQIRILFHKALYRFYLCRKSVVLFVRRCLIRFHMFRAERELVTKYGRNWRSGVINDECVKALKVFDNVHRVFRILPNARGERRG